MTPQEKRDHLRDLIQRQHSMLNVALKILRAEGKEASQVYHWVNEADRFSDLMDRTAFTLFPVGRK